MCLFRRSVMKKTIPKAISAILCIILILGIVSVSAAEKEPIPVVNGIANPAYDSDTKSSIYSYVYFGHYPQSEIKGDDLTENIINANYNAYGVAIVNNKQVCIKNDRYFFIEPIKWKVLNIDKNFMLLQTEKIIDHGINYEYGTGNKWKISFLRSWLNGYSANANIDAKDCSGDIFSSFKGCAFFEEEYDTCQLIDTEMTSDYIVLPDEKMIINEQYGFENNYAWYGIDPSVTRQMQTTDFAAASAEDSPYSYDLNGWYLIDNYVNHNGETHDFYSIYGIAPIVKILVDSDQYYTSKPELKMGKDISVASVNLKYDSIMYDGTPKTPSVTVTENNETLEEDVDYTVKYSDNTKAGNKKRTNNFKS